MDEQRLAEFARAWQRGDIEALMRLMAGECTYITTTPEGRLQEGAGLMGLPPGPRRRMMPRMALDERGRVAGQAPSPVALHQDIGALDGAHIVTIECAKRAGSLGFEQLEAYGLVLLRRGGFLRTVAGRPAWVDASCGYFERPGVEQAIAHQVDGGDACTVVVLSDDAVVAYAGDAVLPDEPMPTSLRIDIEHRALVMRLRQGIDHFEVDERLTRLLGAFTERALPGRLSTCRPETDTAHRRIVDLARQAIAADPASVDLGQLARDMGHSRFHVSRVFSRITGTTLAQHRNRMRVTFALDRLAAGERNLALLAADLGFVDQSHMVRVVRQATGESPSRLRSWFSELAAPREARAA